MSLKIVQSKRFSKEFKRLMKRYESLLNDYEQFIKSLEENPSQGVEIAPNIRKIRMAIASKGRGKSGGTRIITLNALTTEQDGIIYLLLIYDKADTPNIKPNAIAELINEIGLNT